MQNEELDPPISKALDELQRDLGKVATTFRDRAVEVGDERWRPMLSWVVGNVMDHIYGFPNSSSWQPNESDLDAATVNQVVGVAMAGMVTELRRLRDRGVAVDKELVVKRITEMVRDI
jgi:hypothetical protein